MLSVSVNVSCSSWFSLLLSFETQAASAEMPSSSFAGSWAMWTEEEFPELAARELRWEALLVDESAGAVYNWAEWTEEYCPCLRPASESEVVHTDVGVTEWDILFMQSGVESGSGISPKCSAKTAKRCNSGTLQSEIDSTSPGGCVRRAAAAAVVADTGFTFARKPSVQLFSETGDVADDVGSRGSGAAVRTDVGVAESDIVFVQSGVECNSGSSPHHSAKSAHSCNSGARQSVIDVTSPQSVPLFSETGDVAGDVGGRGSGAAVRTDVVFSELDILFMQSGVECDSGNSPRCSAKTAKSCNSGALQSEIDVTSPGGCARGAAVAAVEADTGSTLTRQTSMQLFSETGDAADHVGNCGSGEVRCVVLMLAGGMPSANAQFFDHFEHVQVKIFICQRRIARLLRVETTLQQHAPQCSCLESLRVEGLNSVRRRLGEVHGECTVAGIHMLSLEVECLAILDDAELAARNHPAGSVLLLLICHVRSVSNRRQNLRLAELQCLRNFLSYSHSCTDADAWDTIFGDVLTVQHCLLTWTSCFLQGLWSVQQSHSALASHALSSSCIRC